MEQKLVAAGLPLAVCSDKRDAWERQPAESSKAFAAFCVYRDMARQCRSQREVARQIGKSFALVSRWAGQWDWTKRVTGWDDECDRVARAARLAEVERIKREDVQNADAMLGAVRAVMARAAANLGRDPRALARWVVVATKMRRDALGLIEPKAARKTTVVNQPDNPDRHGISDKELLDFLHPETRKKLHDLAVELTVAQNRANAGGPEPEMQNLIHQLPNSTYTKVRDLPFWTALAKARLRAGKRL